MSVLVDAPPLEAPAGRWSLAPAAAVGACVGLAIGSAYVAGALARGAVQDAAARSVAGGAPTRAASLSASGGARDPVMRLRAALAPVTIPAPARTVRSAGDVECLSEAVYYEARGEMRRGREAVAQVVLNRLHHPRFPKSVCGVVFQRAAEGCAFSFTCDGSAHRPREPAAWREARDVALRALSGFTVREVAAATDFRAAVAAPQGLLRVAQIGAHTFYRPGGLRVRGPLAAPEAPVAAAPVLIKAEAVPAEPPRAAGTGATPAA